MTGDSASDSWSILEQQSSAQATADILDALSRKRRRVLAPMPDQDMAAWLARLQKMLDWHAESVSNALPSTVRQRVNPDRVIVRVRPSVYLNALTIAAGDGGRVVILNVGLMMFIYKFARAVTAHLMPAETSEQTDLETTVTRIADLLDWATSPANTPRGGDWPMDPNALRAAENCTQVAERYVLCHEFAHVAAQHATSEQSRPADLDGVTIPTVVTTPEQEFEADLLGLEFLLKATGSDGSHLQKTYLGCELFLSALALYEGILGSGEYPPAELRLRLVREHIATRWPTELGAVARLYNTVIEPVVADAPEAVLRKRAAIGPLVQHYFNRYASEGTERESQPAFFEWGTKFLEMSPGATLGVIDRELHHEQVGPGGAITPDGLRRWNLAFSFANNLPLDLRTAMLPWKQKTAAVPMDSSRAQSPITPRIAPVQPKLPEGGQ